MRLKHNVGDQDKTVQPELNFGNSERPPVNSVQLHMGLNGEDLQTQSQNGVGLSENGTQETEEMSRLPLRGQCLDKTSHGRRRIPDISATRIPR